jgi:hypothetical protein
MVRAITVTAAGWTWQMAAHGPLGSVLSILLAIGIGGAVLHGVMAGVSTATTHGPPASPDPASVRPGEGGTTTAARLPGTAVPAPAQPLLSDNDEYSWWLFARPVIYLVNTEAEADVLRYQLAEKDAERADMGAPPRDDIIVVAGTEEEAARAAVTFLHRDAIFASLGVPSLPVIDLRSR